jgi:hypothetical protein
MAFEIIGIHRWYRCLSGDVKNTIGIEDGSELWETDTGKKYRFDGTSWIKISNSVMLDYLNVSTSENSGLVTVNTTEGGIQLAPANANRINIIMQNQGTIPILLKFGDSVSISDYNFIIPGGTGVRYGDGGSYSTETQKGKIMAITEATSTVISVFEEEVI